MPFPVAGGGRVLIAEGDHTEAARLTDLLEQAGFTTLSVPAAMAFVTALVFEPDVAVVWLDTPGEGLARRLSALPSGERPVVFAVVPSTDSATRDRAARVGVDDCVPTGDGIVERVERAVTVVGVNW